jgi:hypothetical protein
MRHTRSEVTARATEEFQALDALVQRLKDVDWLRLVPRPETRDPWTVKDAVVHIVYWKEHTARVFRGERRPMELRGLDVPALNHVIWQRWRERSPAEVEAWHRQVHADVMQTLADKPDGWFSAREHAAFWPGDFQDHSASHRLKDIEAALAKVDSLTPLPPPPRSPRGRGS